MDIYIYPAARADEDESLSPSDHHHEHQALPQEGTEPEQGPRPSHSMSREVKV